MNWKKRLEENYTSIEDLKNVLLLSDEEVNEIRKIEERYPIAVPKYYLEIIDKNNLADPIRKMSVPSLMEFSSGGSSDTSGEKDNTVVQGMQHKYRETALILSTNQCAMYCRHCFRKRLVGLSSEEIASKLPEMRHYVKEHKEIDNILISGGDAFMLSDEMIEKYLETFAPLENIKFIRFGTRVPVSFPYRITEDDGKLTSILERYNKIKPITIVTQFNHPNELTEEARKAIAMLRYSGCMVRNQTVLLKGVNDNADTLALLMKNLLSSGVMPYYVFQCRPVEGVKNQFQVPLKRGIEITDGAKGMLSGLEKPFRYVMSHPEGKIEILGILENRMIYKFHQAKNRDNLGRIFTRKLDEEECWFDEIEN